MLDRNAILAANDAKLTRLEVPEWGGEVFIRCMSGKDRDEFEQKVQGKQLSNIRAVLAAISLCDSEGKRLFNDSEIELLGAKSAAALDRVFSMALKINRIGAADVDELKKN